MNLTQASQLAVGLGIESSQLGRMRKKIGLGLDWVGLGLMNKTENEFVMGLGFEPREKEIK